MLEENARRFTSAPRESPIGSSPLKPTPVDSHRKRAAMCPTRDRRRIGATAGAMVFPPTAESARSAPPVNAFPRLKPVTTLAGSPQSRNFFQISGLSASREAPYGIAEAAARPIADPAAKDY